MKRQIDAILNAPVSDPDMPVVRRLPNILLIGTIIAHC